MSIVPVEGGMGSFDFESEFDKQEAARLAEENKIARHLSPNDPRWNAINMRRQTNALETIADELVEIRKCLNWMFMLHMYESNSYSKQILEYMEKDAKESA